MASAFSIRVKYTNASRKEDEQFLVVADSESDAVRYLFDADVVGSDMSTMDLRKTDTTVIIQPWHVNADDMSVIKAT